MSICAYLGTCIHGPSKEIAALGVYEYHNVCCFVSAQKRRRLPPKPSIPLPVIPCDVHMLWDASCTGAQPGRTLGSAGSSHPNGRTARAP